MFLCEFCKTFESTFFVTLTYFLFIYSPKSSSTIYLTIVIRAESSQEIRTVFVIISKYVEADGVAAQVGHKYLKHGF